MSNHRQLQEKSPSSIKKKHPPLQTIMDLLAPTSIVLVSQFPYGITNTLEESHMLNLTCLQTITNTDATLSNSLTREFQVQPYLGLYLENPSIRVELLPTKVTSQDKVCSQFTSKEILHPVIHITISTHYLWIHYILATHTSLFQTHQIP